MYNLSALEELDRPAGACAARCRRRNFAHSPRERARAKPVAVCTAAAPPLTRPAPRSRARPQRCVQADGRAAQGAFAPRRAARKGLHSLSLLGLARLRLL